MGYIYLRTNLSNGKCYVGQAKDIKERNYTWNYLNKRYAGYAIENARKKYGADGFSFEILRECPNEDMNYWEMYYIKEYNSKIPYGYNMTDGGDSVYEKSDETRKKIGEAQRGKPKPKVSAALRGRKLSPEHVAKVAAAHRGMKRSDETKARIAVSKRGKKRPAEVVAKCAAARRGKPNPKVAAALKGRKHSPEHIAKVAAAHRGMKRSDETKAKMSAAQKNNPKCSKAVQALDKDGNVVMEFPSTREAQRKGFDASSVSKCCNGKVKTHKGYIWRYKENAQE